MKKTITILTAFFFLIACGSNTSNTASEVKEESSAEADKGEDPEVTRGMELIAKSDCLTCHQIVDASVGPAYEAVAAKYPNNDAVIDSLAGKIINGGAGNWGTTAMPPHPDLQKEDARTMVKYVLSLKK